MAGTILRKDIGACITCGSGDPMVRGVVHFTRWESRSNYPGHQFPVDDWHYCNNSMFHPDTARGQYEKNN